MTDSHSAWEQRASAYGKDLSGVLFQGLSASANAAIDRWHSWVTRTHFSSGLPVGARVLDLGCGYGRLTATVATHRPDLEIIGQDLSFEYCKLYKDTEKTCIQAEAERLPFKDNTFDGVMAITCLMYTQRSSRSTALQELYRIVKPGGVLFIIDPGMEMQRLIATVRRHSPESPTGGKGFTRKEYVSLSRDAGFDIEEKGGNPWLSSILMTPFIARSSSRLATRLMNTGMRLDCSTSGYSATALHRWLLLRRN